MHTLLESVANADSSTLTCNDSANDSNAIIQDWQSWCRLCAKRDTEGNVNIILKDEKLNRTIPNGLDETVNGSCSRGGGGDLNLAIAIDKYFNVQITHEEELPKMMCAQCFSLVTTVVNFSERVAKVQQMFHTLLVSKNAKIDTNVLRLKYGILDDDDDHGEQVPVHPNLPEVHYFEMKPKISELEDIHVDEVIMANPLEQQRAQITIKKEITLDSHVCDDASEDDINYDDNCEGRKQDEEDPFNNNDDVINHLEDVNKLLMPSTKTAATESSASENEYIKTHRKRKIKTKLKNILSDHIETPKKRVRRKTQLDKTKLNKKSSTNIDQKNDNNETVDNDDDDDDDDEDDDPKTVNGIIIPCSECPRKFKRVQHYSQHMSRTHAKVAKCELSCQECSRVFNTQYQLQQHARTHLPLEQKKTIPCPYCDKKFTLNALVQTHIKHIHMNERPFVCEECGVAVRTNGSLKTHMLTHTDYAPFECEVCKKGFKNQIRLKNHMETHDPNKHICAKCGLQLNSRATLNRHLLVHSDEMQHKCDYCGRAFKRAKALKTHLILHTGLKPYSCNFCDRTFANGSNCRSHKKKAHPEELAALEASGGGKTYTRNIPKLEALKAVTKTADNLAPVVSKQSGCFAFGKKPKPPPKEPTNRLNKQKPAQESIIPGAATTTANNDINILQGTLSATTLAAESNRVTSIPTIDNIYSHIMKQASLNANESNANANDTTAHDMAAHMALYVKRSPSQASSSCIAIEQDLTNDMPSQLPQFIQQQQHIHIQSQQQQSSPPKVIPTKCFRVETAELL